MTLTGYLGAQCIRWHAATHLSASFTIVLFHTKTSAVLLLKYSQSSQISLDKKRTNLKNRFIVKQLMNTRQLDVISAVFCVPVSAQS